MRKIRFAFAAAAVLAFAAAGTPDAMARSASGGTTHEYVYHAAGNIAGEAWFNSGTANPSKGRNSFTIKDDLCNDGWAIEVHFKIAGSNTLNIVGLNSDCTGSSSERSFSAYGAQPSPQTLLWQACKRDTHGISATTCSPIITTTIS